jgi:hypothetical protein
VTTPPRQHTASAGGSAASKGNKFNSKHFGASFSPGFTLNVNANNRSGSGGAAGFAAPGGSRGVHADSLLPAPEFNSPAQVRQYCNHLRAVMTGISFEISMAAEILKGVLAQVPDPEGRLGGSRIRAARVSRKLAKSADAARDAAKNAAACYQQFVQQYEQEIARVRHRASRPHRQEMNWAQQ